MSVEYIEQVYNSYSGVYDFFFGKVFQSGRELGPELLDLSADNKLLEVGVGTGLSLPLLPRNVEITGIDLSEKMLAIAKKRAADLNLKNVKLLKMDATKLDFPDQSFDRILEYSHLEALKLHQFFQMVVRFYLKSILLRNLLRNPIRNGFHQTNPPGCPTPV
jgi:phosphatidylethanolamine/phosphatidyl-N-methylethanolamine N-methyltransferase